MVIKREAAKRPLLNCYRGKSSRAAKILRTAAFRAAARAACSNARDSDSLRFLANALLPTWACSSSRTAAFQAAALG